MSTVGSIDVQIRADISNLQQSLRTMQSRLQSATSNVATQTNSIANSFKNMSKMIGTSIATYVVFKGLDLMTNGLMNTIKVYNQFESASMGLKSILDAQGKSFQEAQGFIKDYVSDGLIPMSDAVTAFKTLSAAGYNIEETEKVMLRLKDASAFGRQASLTMGEAVRSASEGIKNENSILLDNSGITKNLSLMWADYATSIGKGVNSLNKQEKIQAVVNGIMAESNFQVGDAAKYSATLGGGLAALNSQFTQLKGAIGAVFAPALSALLPFITSAISKFMEFATVLASISKYLFGTSSAQKATAQSTNAMAKESSMANKSASGMGKAQDKLAKGVKKAGKAVSDNLQGFDELHQLQKDVADSASEVANSTGDTGEGAGAGSGGTTTTTLDVKVDPVVDGALNSFKSALENLKSDLVPIVDYVKNNFGQSFQTATKNINNSFVNLGLGLVAFSNGVWTNFKIAVLDYIKNTDFTPQIKAINTTIKNIGDAIALIPNLVGLFALSLSNLVWENKEGFRLGIQNVIDAIKDMATEFLNLVNGNWTIFKTSVLDYIQKTDFTPNLNNIKNAVSNIGDTVVSVSKFFTELFRVIKEVNFNNSEKISSALANLYDGVGDLITNFGELETAIPKDTADFFAKLLERNADMIKNVYGLAIELVTGLIDGMGSVFTTVSDAIMNAYKNNIEPLKELMLDVWGSISNVINSLVTNVIRPLLLPAFTSIKTVVDDVFPKIGEKISNIFNNIIDIVKVLWEKNLKPMVDWISQKFLPAIKPAMDEIGLVFKNIFESAINLVDKFSGILEGLTKFLKGIFTDDWKLAFEGISLIVENIFKGLVDIIRIPINSMIRLINKFLDKLSSIKISIPEVDIPGIGKMGGGSVGFPKLSIGEIPALASGGIISSPTMAMIGEGRYSEVVQPLGGPKYDALIEGVANAVVSAMSITSQNNKQSGDITLQVDGKTIAKVLNPYIESEQKRSNTRLVLST